MKPVIYYTFVKTYGDWRVLGVTSEGPGRRINGRWSDTNEPTHTTKHLTYGSFSDPTKAAGIMEKIKQIAKVHFDIRTPLHDQLNESYHAEERTIKELFK